MRRRRRGEDRAPRARRDPDLRARAGGVGRAQSERLHFSTELAPALEHARLLFVAVGTPPTYSGDADLSAVHAVVDAMPASDHHALVMKSTVPVGTGAAIRRVFAEHGKDGLRLRLVPRVPQRGLGARGLPASPTASSSATTATGPATRSSSSTRRWTRRWCDRHRQRRDGQARRQRLPGDQDLVHQRDRQRLRGDRRRRARGRPRDGPRPRIGRTSSSRGSASAARAFPRTSPRSSSWPATPATTSSCSPR